MSDLEKVFQSYLDLRWHFHPAAATEAGVTSQNERLGDYDLETIRANLAAFRAMSVAVEQLEIEDVQSEIDRTALLNEIRSTLWRFEHEQPHVRNPAFWLSQLYRSLYSLLDRQEVPRNQLARSAVARLRAVPAFLASAAETLRDPAPVLLETAEAMIDGGETLIGQVARFCRAHSGTETEEADVAAAEAEAALTRFGLALKTELATSDDVHGFATGEDQFNRRLHLEHALNSSAPELWRYGMHLVGEVEGRLEECARAMDAGSDWRGLVDRLRKDSPVPGDPIEACRAAMERARYFVGQRDLATIPAAALEVVPTPEFLRPLIPFAAYSPPGAFSADRTGRFYVTPRSPEMRQIQNRSTLELAGMALHEGYPGHHLQMITAQSLPSAVRRVLWTPLMVEGWALYCEDMMGEEGFYDDSAARLLQQVHLLWRAVRVILDIGLHTRNMSPDAAVVYLLSKVPVDRTEAIAEVRRYCGSPTYPLCYAVGRREILALREDYRIRAGSNFVLRTFHDELLSYGGLPISLARWGMGLESEK